jgi:hypothetical protein
MIAPLLPKAQNLATYLSGKVDYVLIDKMNYHYADRIYRKYKLEHAKTDRYFTEKKNELTKAFEIEKIPCKILF